MSAAGQQVVTCPACGTLIPRRPESKVTNMLAGHCLTADLDEDSRFKGDDE